MSDIIYTPPASSGSGTTINPTNEFIPVRSNATTFIDSNITNIQDDYILTLVGSNLSNSNGLKIDFTNVNANLGDFLGIYNGTNFKVDYLNDNIITQWSGNDIGLRLDFANNVYFLGDFNGVNGTNSSFSVDNNNGIIYTQGYATENGILLDFSTNQYFLGDYNGTGNTSHISIKDSGKNITLSTNGGIITNICDSLVFSGALTTGSASGNSGQHLQVTINGTPYVIQLLNP
jgi:hypothetical protein